MPCYKPTLLVTALHCTAATLRCCPPLSCNWSALYCIARCIGCYQTIFCFATSTQRPSSVSWTKLAERRCLLERLRPSSAVFYKSGSLRESESFICLCHAQLISRSSSESQAAISCSRSRAWQPHCHDSVAHLRTASYLRSTLPASAILPCAYNHLPSGTAVILNS